jgi:alkylhydroperoxidase/carboxymuconolactone decarboxylase family protein YurZ
MNPQNAHLIAFADALTTGRLHQFEGIVKAAYRAGVNRQDLLIAVEMGRLLVEVPSWVVSRAYAAVHAWHWIVARRGVPQRAPVALAH